MKKLIFFILFFTQLFASYLPLSSQVMDMANVLDKNTKSKLLHLLINEENDSTNQIVILTIKSLQGKNIQDYSIDLARHWKLGQKGKDNGVLFLVVTEEKELRIEVGYGLEDVLTDLIASEIIQKIIIPEFKNGDFNKGILKGTQEILKALQGNYSFTKNKQSNDTTKYLLALPIIGFAFLFLAIFIKNAFLTRITIASWFAFIPCMALHLMMKESIIPFIMIVPFMLLALYLFRNKNLLFKNEEKKDFNKTFYKKDSFKRFHEGYSGKGGNFGGGGASGKW